MEGLDVFCPCCGYVLDEEGICWDCEGLDENGCHDDDRECELEPEEW